MLTFPFPYRPLYLILLILLALCSGISAAKRSSVNLEDLMRFRHFHGDAGLVSEEVTALTQDQNGFLWIAGKAGLQRFDGYAFRSYGASPGDSLSLNSEDLTSLCLDISNGDTLLWIGSREGLSRLDMTRDRFHHFHPQPGDSLSLNAESVHTLLKTRDGTLWIGTRGGGLARMIQRPSPDNDFRPRFKRYTSGPGENRISNNFIRRLYEDDHGRIWISTSYGLSVLDPRTERIRNYYYRAGDSTSISSNSVFAVTGDRHGHIWVSTLGGSGLQQATVAPDGTVRFKRMRPAEKKGGRFSSVIFDIHVDRKDRLWLASADQGLIRFDGRRFTFFTHEEQNRESVVSNNLFRLFEDKDGGLWVASVNDGLSYTADIYPERVAIRRLTTANSPLADNRIHNIRRDAGGRIWLGTENGLYAYRLRGENFASLSLIHSLGSVSLKGLTINELLPARDGTLWFSSDLRAGLGGVHLPTGKIVSDIRARNPLGLPSNSVTALFEDRFRRLWVGSFSGLSLLPKEKGRFRNFTYDPNNSNTPASSIVTGITQINDTLFWVGTENGLSRMSVNRRGRIRFENYHHQAAAPGSLGNNFIKSLLADGKGTLWIITGGGLEWTRATEKPPFFRQAGGVLNSSTLQNILIDRTGKLWISAPGALLRYDPADSSLRRFTRADGLSRSDINYKAAASLPDGRLLFGSQDGLNIVYPARLTDNAPPPGVHLTGLYILNRALAPGSGQLAKALPYEKHLFLKHSDNVITLHYAAPAFRTPEAVRYRYRLKGFDRDWIEAGKRRSVQYTNLDPGSYTFMVAAENAEGNRMGPVATLAIHVAPPLWRTWWAYLGYALLILGFLASIRRYEKNKERLERHLEREKLEAEKWREIDQAKNVFFTNISHEFRTPLTLIIAPLQQMLEKGSGGEKRHLSGMLRQARRLLNLVNQLLEISRISSGKISLKAVYADIIAPARGIFYSFASYAEQKDIESVFESSAESCRMWFDREKLEHILINLLSNAYKFTAPGGRVSLHIFHDRDSRQRPCLALKIRDNGPGLTEEEQRHIFDRYYRTRNTDSIMGSGIGLALVRQLVEVHRGEIRVESTPGRGSSFCVLLPLGRDHLREEEIVNNTEGSVPPPHPEPEEGQIPAETLWVEQAPLLLLVEDTDEVRHYIVEIFEGRYNIKTANNGRQALDMARDELPDIIVSDVMMPEMNGYELCRRLKSDSLTDHIPVILLTARATEEDKLTGLQTGADAYVAKPFNPRELRLRVQKLLEQRRLLREKFTRRFIEPPRPDKSRAADTDRFLRQATQTVMEHLKEESFNVEAFAAAMALSRMQLHRKIKALTGKSTTEFIRVVRLRQAAEMLKNKSGNVSEIAFAVGFNNLSYFVRSFHKQYGVPPSQYR